MSVNEWSFLKILYPSLQNDKDTANNWQAMAISDFYSTASLEKPMSPQLPAQLNFGVLVFKRDQNMKFMGLSHSEGRDLLTDIPGVKGLYRKCHRFHLPSVQRADSMDLNTVNTYNTDPNTQ